MSIAVLDPLWVSSLFGGDAERSGARIGTRSEGGILKDGKSGRGEKDQLMLLFLGRSPGKADRPWE
ncbi:hypothetical protein HMPREF0620_0577 [Parascardovia denticolens DSM 10105 = JCM 12538]|uniref:Uncharacterized protein n=1 Tax=Parascardovia denticolens DSM 10105 = JCM 12538 TaxID=864564 RepID=E6K191_PARDN|nr:hypothetical protein HMPREF0620_0577 [Parascardovia denticolens DSM 10105 = JCM 12538]